MEDIRKEQKEALKVFVDFNQRIAKNIKIVIKELSGERLGDTDLFLKGIIDAINWEIGVVNGTISFLNKDKIRVDKNEFNKGFVTLSDAVSSKDDLKIVEAFEELLLILEMLGKAAEEVIR